MIDRVDGISQIFRFAPVAGTVFAYEKKIGRAITRQSFRSKIQGLVVGMDEWRSFIGRSIDIRTHIHGRSPFTVGHDISYINIASAETTFFAGSKIQGPFIRGDGRL